MLLCFLNDWPIIFLYVIVSLYESSLTVWTLVRFLSSVDLPVSVQTAGISQQFTTLFTLDCCLAIGSNHVSSGKTKLNLNKESLTKQTLKALKIFAVRVLT